MQQTQEIKRLTIGLTIINLLFFIYYFFLSIYSRLFFDDYNSLSLLREAGFKNYIYAQYTDTGGRFVNYFINGIISWIIEITGTINYFSFIAWLIGSFSLFLIVRKVL